MKPKKLIRSASIIGLFISFLMLYGCSSNVGIGLSVGVPVGNHGYISLGSGRWH